MLSKLPASTTLPTGLGPTLEADDASSVANLQTGQTGANVTATKPQTNSPEASPKHSSLGALLNLKRSHTNAPAAGTHAPAAAGDESSSKRARTDSNPGPSGTAGAAGRGQTHKAETSSAGGAEAATTISGREAKVAASSPTNKISVALVDSGAGGGMTAALLEGKVHQLGSYYCLPIGDKPAKLAEVYTAAMALSSLVQPLKNKEGNYNTGLADNVIIACNSASVRRDGALEILKAFCAKAKESGEFLQGLGPDVQTAIKEIGNDVGSLDSRIHELVTPTVTHAIEMMLGALENKDDFSISINSTNGTVASGAYPNGFIGQLEKRFGSVTLEVPPQESRVSVDGAEYKINHSKLSFTGTDGKKKNVYIENRGNPPWVPAIEGNSYQGERGQRLVSDAREASRQALDQLHEGAFAGKFDHKPDLVMLCCTHYPALKDAIKADYGNVAILDQAEVVAKMVGDIPGARTTGGDESGPPDLTVTVATRHEGGVTARENLTPEKDQEKLNATRDTIKTVIDGTRQGKGLNSPSDVAVYRNDPAQEREFETLHAMLGLFAHEELGKDLMPGYTADIDKSAYGNPAIANPKVNLTNVKARDPAMANRPEPLKMEINPEVRATLARKRKQMAGLASMMTKGETRGIEALSAHVDTAAHLEAAVAQIASTIENNKGKAEAEKTSIGILTGFSVLDKENKDSIGGENDGPPGTVIMAKTFMDQGTPVSLVTDQSSESALMVALEGAGLATRKPGTEQLKGQDLKAGNFDLKAGLHVDIGASSEQIPQIKANLAQRKTNTMISIERPSPSSEGGPYSMGGFDVGPHNLDMNDVLSVNNAYTIGIGDGGNEVGMGRVKEAITEMRGPDTKLVVNNGPRIAANVSTDALVMATVSNNGGVALSLATLAALDATDTPDRMEQTVTAYNNVVATMHANEISIDGVNKENALTVDGRDLGNMEVSMAEGRPGPGEPGRTHNDTFRQMIKTLNGDEA